MKSSGLSILIAYDGRSCLLNTKCMHAHLLYVYEAISLITLSFIYSEKPNDIKPKVYSLVESENLEEIEIDHDKSLEVCDLVSILFTVSKLIGCYSLLITI